MDPQIARDQIAKAWNAITHSDWEALGSVGHEGSAVRSEGSAWATDRGAIVDYFRHYAANYHLDMSNYTAIVMGERAAVETRLKLTYHTTKDGFPEARGQSVIVPVGTFITFRENLFYRTQMFLSIEDWMRIFTADPAPQGAGEGAQA
ncbi:MAG: hypothetical protein VX874_11695 [Pseudomonadota bacterium]|nr:hypothetical protein [Pseudomonadota bacterium]